MYEELASQGYLVVAIDHPYDALVVEFPEGGAAYMADSSGDLDTILEFLDTRVADAKFVVKQLTKLPCASSLDLDNIGMFGHSLGGATSAGAMAGKNSLVKAGINLDGSIFGPLNNTDVKGPFLLVGTTDHNSARNETSWKSFKKAQNGWVKEVTFKGFTHLTFSDMATDVELLGLERFFPPGDLEKELGSDKPKRVRQLVAAYVDDFFGWALKGGKGNLLKGPSKQYPEVEFVV
jgi:dienelactone hydrolase